MEYIDEQLKGYEIKDIEITSPMLKQYNNEFDFVSIAVDLHSDVAKLVHAVSNINRLDSNGKPRKLNRNEAIIGGLMCRISKLHGILHQQFCNNQMFIAYSVLRSIVESIVNLMYLIKKNTQELYDEYIKFSLKQEKKLLNEIEGYIRNRNGSDLPIEIRMKRSIMRAFDHSSYKIEDIDENDKKPFWGDSLRNKLKFLDLERLYISTFALPSHFVHGNWQELLQYHLSYETDGYTLKMDLGTTMVQPITSLIALSSLACEDYVNDLIPDSPDKNYFISKLDKNISKAYLIDRNHELFIQKQMRDYKRSLMK